VLLPLICQCQFPELCCFHRDSPSHSLWFPAATQDAAMKHSPSGHHRLQPLLTRHLIHNWTTPVSWHRIPSISLFSKSRHSCANIRAHQTVTRSDCCKALLSKVWIKTRLFQITCIGISNKSRSPLALSFLPINYLFNTLFKRLYMFIYRIHLIYLKF